MEPRLICLIGAECTGKTTLAQALAHQMGGLWVPEYLRSFTQAHGRTPQRAEQLPILQEPLRMETKALSQAREQGHSVVFCDTAPLLTAVYSDCVFADTSLYLQALSMHARYALTLFLQPDVPWQADGLQRDGPEARAAVHDAIVRALAPRCGGGGGGGGDAWPVVRIAGTAAQRLVQACDAVAGAMRGSGI
jgi:nicotinamide riboside kinase